MTISDFMNDLSSDDASDAHISDRSDSDSDESQHATFQQLGGLRPAGSAPSFVPFALWKPERSYDGAQTLRYNVEWKLFVKNRERAGQSELDIVLSPKHFWKHILQPKLTEASDNKPWKAAAALLVLSVNDRKTKSIKKRYATQKEIEWPFVAKTIQSWSKSLGSEKTFSLDVKFYYEQSAQQNTAKTGRSATIRQRAELGAIISEEVAYMGRPAAIRTAYATMRYTGPPCPIKGSTHCWVYEGKHRRLLPHHMQMLADHLQSGGVLNSHDDVPENFRKQILGEEHEWEERERKEREKKRKRQRRDSFESPSILSCAPCSHDARPAPPKMVFPASPLFQFNRPRQKVMADYNAWQRSQSESDEEQYYDIIEELNKVHGYTLEMIACNQDRMCTFYQSNEVPEGIAWSYVCYSLWYGKQHGVAQGLEIAC